MESTNRPPTPSSGQATEELAALTALTARLDRLAIRIARQIRAEVPGYAALPSPEHDRDVRSQISAVLAGLQARMPPPEAAIEHARAVGRRRAAAGLALPDVIEAYHIAYREIWNELLGLAGPFDRPPPGAGVDDGRAEALVGLVGLLWNWFHRLSAAVAEAHVEQARRAATTRAALHRRLVEAIVAGAAEQALPVARDLGFDVAGPFLVACAEGVPETAVEAVADRLARLSGPALCSPDGDRLVLVAQGCPEEELAAAVHAVVADARVGVGLERTGPAGAALGLLDADDALRRSGAADPTGGAGPGRTVRFADDWLLAVLGRESGRLAQPLAAGAAVARANPALAATVRAFAEQQFSVTACARVLHIHPNSAKYRLDRWQALTGWDPRSFAGLSASMVCLDLTGAPDPADDGPPEPA